MMIVGGGGGGEVVWLALWAIKLWTSPGLLSIVTLPPVLPCTSETLTGREELARLLTNPVNKDHLGFKPRIDHE